jgi:ubiquinone/menaquinone biosynthesis C-methylase UbiE
MLSIGSGISSHELKLARLNPAWDITCIDFAEKPLRHAEQTAREEGLSNIHFIVEDIYKYKLEADSCDLVFFHSSLHHFKNLENFMEKIFRAMKTPGQLIINEYVGPNRMQYSREQLKEINHCLSLIDRKYRKIHRTNLYKNRFYGSGWIRMIVSDPSECVESEKILPTIYRYFKTGEEKAYGGNLIMPVLKDISQNFVHLDGAKTQSLETIFACEDRYLKHHPSDFIFGIYEKNG